ncbi:MAG: AI-2E family transporter, partial [Bacteroidetes bacterium]|nr:AI-2E family transporter [Bacteroidota bacterium]MBU1578483.1 AI-2E family transporter [Bacteroidota bacterium]
AIIPVIYAFVSYDSIWIAVAVALLFWFVQLVSDNFLTPSIVGGSLKINALTAILSLFIGASVWGLAGMILFLPFAAMIRVVCEEFEELKPVALMMGEHNKKGSDGTGQLSLWWEKMKKRL